MSERARPAPSRATSAEPEAILDERRRRRLWIYGPVMAFIYLFLAWFFVGVGLLWFALTGGLVGVFAAWRQRGEVLLGIVAAVAAIVVCILAVGAPLFFIIVPAGIAGYVAAIDDRMRSS